MSQYNSATPKPGEFYRHFKGKIYQVINIAKHTETNEDLVMYQAMYGDFGIYARPLEMFISDVDGEKYPEVTQKKRFQSISRDEILKECSMVEYIVHKEEPSVEFEYGNGEVVNPILLAFIDEDTLERKLEILVREKDHLTDEIVDGMAASLDLVIPEDDIENRYKSLRKCIEMQYKFEGRHLR